MLKESMLNPEETMHSQMVAGPADRPPVPSLNLQPKVEAKGRRRCLDTCTAAKGGGGGMRRRATAGAFNYSHKASKRYTYAMGLLIGLSVQFVSEPENGIPTPWDCSSG